LCLAEFDDRAEAQLVPGLREGKSLDGLLAKLIGNGDATKCGLRVEDGDADIAGDGIGEILRLFFGGFLTQASFLRLGIDAESGEQREGQVDSTGGVPVGDEDSRRCDVMPPMASAEMVGRIWRCCAVANFWSAAASKRRV
jgi:hypothetical protein